LSFGSHTAQMTSTLVIGTAFKTPAGHTTFSVGVASEKAGRLNASGNGALDVGVLGVTASVTADDKTYNGDKTATILDGRLDTPLLGDDVRLAIGSATSSDQTADDNKTVTASALSLSGAAAGNYRLINLTATDLANITEKPITGTFTVFDKTYNRDIDATI